MTVTSSSKRRVAGAGSKPTKKEIQLARASQLQAHPQSFSMVDVYRQRMEQDGLSKGQRTQIKLKIGVALALQDLPYQVMRVADITTAADISYGLFYHYYKDKQAATIDVLAEFLEHLEKEYREIHGGTDEYDSLYQPNLFYLDVNRRNAGIVRACLTVSEEVESFQTTWVELIDRWHRRMAYAIRRTKGKADRFLPDDELIAYCLGGMIDQLCRQVYAQQNPFVSRLVTDTEHLAETVSIMWYRVIYGRNPTVAQIKKSRPNSSV